MTITGEALPDDLLAPEVNDDPYPSFAGAARGRTRCTGASAIAPGW